jgi:hypothetical protein
MSSLLLHTRTVFAAPASIDLLEAINQAGRERMLSQRSAKLYSQMLKGIRVDESRTKLTASVARFESQLNTLRTFARTESYDEVSATYDQLAERWTDQKAIVTAKPTLDALRALVDVNETVLALAHKATQQLEQHSTSPVGALVNLCGRQRMLSQRMAKCFSFRSNGLDTPAIAKQLESARTDFVAALKVLADAPQDTAEIRSWLVMADNQWLFFDQALNTASGKAAGSDPQVHLGNVAVTSENLLEVMDKLTGLYSALKGSSS